MRTTSLILAAALAAVTGWTAETPPNHDIEERLQRLEREVRELREENRQLRQQLDAGPLAPDPAPVRDEALRQELGLDGKGKAGLVKPAGSAAELRFGGYVQAQAEFGDDGDARWSGQAANDRFYVRRARLHTFGRFFEHFNFRVELDLAGALGEQSGMRAQLTDGWVSWNQLDFANVKFGQFFPTIGYELRYAPAMLLSIENSYAGNVLLPNRQLGLEASGALGFQRLFYAFGAFNGNHLNNNWNDNDNFMTAGRAGFIPFQGLLFDQDATWSVAGGGYFSDDDLASFRGRRVGGFADTQLRIGRFDFWSELFYTRYEPDAGAKYDARGWYALGSYYLVPAKLQALVRYDTYDPNTDLEGNSTDTWTLGLNYYIKGHSLKLMVNYLLVDAPGEDDLQHKVLTRLQAAF